MLTTTGLLFIGDRYRRIFLAMSAVSGATIWSPSLPAEATATPISYTFNKEQFVVLMAGGRRQGSDIPGDYVLAWNLRHAD